jgi:hypothetical protein
MLPFAVSRHALRASTVLFLAVPVTSHAVAEKTVDFKLTGSYYQSRKGNDAHDVNLRASLGASNVWLGRYEDREGFRQTRFGYDTRIEFDHARVSLSPEFGSGGYAGAYAGTELGGQTFAIAGICRSNLRPFYNLGFDPCESITIGVGTRAIDRTDLSFYQVRDDRIGNGQRVTHLSWRYKVADDQRLTIVATHKRGLSDENAMIHGYGLTIGYDYKDFFARIGRDQYANFIGDHLNRAAFGMRF